MSPRVPPRAAAARAAASAGAAEAEGDASLLDRLQRAAFEYIRGTQIRRTGWSRTPRARTAPCSIAVVGFALSVLPCRRRTRLVLAQERGRTGTDDPALPLRSAQDAGAAATGYKGFYYHFLDMSDGPARMGLRAVVHRFQPAAGRCAGRRPVLRPHRQEAEIRESATALYHRVDWCWAQNNSPVLAQGWHPDFGFLHYGWEGYNEALIIYILGLGSPTTRCRTAAS